MAREECVGRLGLAHARRLVTGDAREIHGRYGGDIGQKWGDVGEIERVSLEVEQAEIYGRYTGDIGEM